MIPLGRSLGSCDGLPPNRRQAIICRAKRVGKRLYSGRYVMFTVRLLVQKDWLDSFSPGARSLTFVTKILKKHTHETIQSENTSQ